MTEIVGILLAAGAGARFGGDKLMHRLPAGIPMAAVAASVLHPACDRLIAVLRPNANELASVLKAVGCEIVWCAEAEAGMGHSLAAGVSATTNAAGWVVALADMPFIAPASHLIVAATLRAGASLVATQFQGQQGHPVGFSRVWSRQLITLTGDRGGKSILNQYQEHLTLCPVDDPGVLQDIDRPDDFQHILQIG